MQLPRWERAKRDLRIELSALVSAWRDLLQRPLRVGKLERFAGALMNVADNRSSIGLFVICIVAGFAMAIVTSSPPTLAVLAFTLWALVFALAFGLQVVVKLWRRQIPMALWLGVWTALLGWLFLIGLTTVTKWVV